MFLTGIDRVCLCAALDRHPLFSVFTPQVKSKYLNLARTSLDNKKQVIPHTDKCARISFCLSVVLINFLVFLGWSFVYITGQGIAPSTGTSEPNIADLAQLLGGRTFGDVQTCYSSSSLYSKADDRAIDSVENSDPTLTQNSRASDLKRVKNGSCTTQLYQDYFNHCWEGNDLKTSLNGRQRVEKMKCYNHQCQNTMLNMYACFRFGNSSMGSVQLASECQDPPPSKQSFDPVAPAMNSYNPNDKNTFLTQEEHKALLHMRWCMSEKCSLLLYRVLFQSCMTILITAIVETLFEAGINRCSRSSFCTTHCMCISWSFIDAVLFLSAALIVHRSVDIAMENFKRQAKQRCIYAGSGGFKVQVVIRYFPVLALTWCTSALTLSLKECCARRSYLALEQRRNDNNNNETETETETSEKNNIDNNNNVELQSNPMKK